MMRRSASYQQRILLNLGIAILFWLPSFGPWAKDLAALLPPLPVAAEAATLAPGLPVAQAQAPTRPTSLLAQGKADTHPVIGTSAPYSSGHHWRMVEPS